MGEVNLNFEESNKPTRKYLPGAVVSTKELCEGKAGLLSSKAPSGWQKTASWA